MKTRIYLLLLFTTALFYVTGCKKGDTGPAGTANVFYSDWFKPETYVKDTIFGIWGFKYNKSVPQITQNILDSGAVLTFGKMLGYNPAVWPTNQVSQLPISISYTSGGLQEDVWTATASPGNLRIRFTNDHNIYTVIANQHVFRYVIIPGGLPASGLNYTYRDIATKYNLPD